MLADGVYDDDDMSSEHSSEGVAESCHGFCEYMEMQSQFLNSDQDLESLSPANAVSSRTSSANATPLASTSRSGSRSTTTSFLDSGELLSVSIFDPSVRLSTFCSGNASANVSSDVCGANSKQLCSPIDRPVSEPSKYFNFGSASLPPPARLSTVSDEMYSNEGDRKEVSNEDGEEVVPVCHCSIGDSGTSSKAKEVRPRAHQPQQVGSGHFKAARQSRQVKLGRLGDVLTAGAPPCDADSSSSLENSFAARSVSALQMSQTRHSMRQQPSQSSSGRSQSALEKAAASFAIDMIAGSEQETHFCPNPLDRIIVYVPPQCPLGGPNASALGTAAQAVGLPVPLLHPSGGHCRTPSSSSLATPVGFPTPRSELATPLSTPLPTPLTHAASKACENQFSIPPSPCCLGEVALPEGVFPGDILNVRIINGVSGEEELHFVVPLHLAAASEKQLYENIDRLCQEHAGQALATLSWLHKAESGSRLQRRHCGIGMIEKLLGDGAPIAQSPSASPLELLLCTVPAQPPSELPAARVRLRSVAPSYVQLGTLSSPAPITAVRLETSQLDASCGYSVAFTHQWSNITHKADATLLPNGNGVKAIVPPAMLAPSPGAGNDGLYDVYLVVDDSYRSGNRRTLTVVSADELSSSSTAGSSTFDPIGRAAP